MHINIPYLILLSVFACSCFDARHFLIGYLCIVTCTNMLGTDARASSRAEILKWYKGIPNVQQLKVLVFHKKGYLWNKVSRILR